MKTTFIISAIVLAFAAGCSKTTNIVPAATLAGEYYGQWSSAPGSAPTQPWYFKIRADHTMVIASTDTDTYSVADSTYYLVPGDSIKCTYRYIHASNTFTIIGKPNSNYSFISGTWGSGSNAYNGGTFFMGRKQE